MKKTFLIFVGLIILISLSGCGIFSGEAGSGLNGTSWTMESYGGKSLLGDRAMTAIFESGEVSGSTSCNHYFGSYQTKGDQLTFGGMGWTEMACMDPEGIMEQESTIMSMLSQTVSYSIEGGKLYLQIDGGEVLVFVPLEN